MVLITNRKEGEMKRKPMLIIVAIVSLSFLFMSCEQPEPFSEYPFSSSTQLKDSMLSDTDVIGGTYICTTGIYEQVFSFAQNNVLYVFDTSGITTGTWSVTDNRLSFAYKTVNVSNATTYDIQEASTGKYYGFYYLNAYDDSIVFVKFTDSVIDPVNYTSQPLIRGKVFGVTNSYNETRGYGFSDAEYCYEYMTNGSSRRCSLAFSNNGKMRITPESSLSEEYVWLVVGDCLVMADHLYSIDVFRRYR